MNFAWADLGGLLQRPLFSVGSTPVTLMSLALVVVLILAIWWLAGLVERTLLRAARHGDGDHPHREARLYLLSRLARYTVWVLGTVVVLNYVGIDLSSVALLGGAVAFGLGFGLQNVFSKTIRDWLLWTVIAVIAMWLISAMYIGVMASSGDGYVTMMNHFPEALAKI